MRARFPAETSAHNSPPPRGVTFALVLLALAFLLPAHAFAQDDEIEEIVVKGIRGSLESATAIKRDESGVVDAITAEDLGRFPDTNLAESLQRIPGVSIDRRNNEGNRVSVRGFGPSFNMVTLNGRQMPAAATDKIEGDSSYTQPRAFNFSEIASEAVAGVNVYKTSRVDQTSGGLGATLDIRTAKPLSYDADTWVATGKFKLNSDLSNEVGDDFTPEISGIVGYNWDGKFGLLFNGSFARRDSREEFIATDGWLRTLDIASGDADVLARINTDAVDREVNPNGQLWLPRNILVDQSDHERERTNFQLTGQWAPTDNFVATADWTYSEYEDKIERSQTAMWIVEGGAFRGVADADGSVTQVRVGEYDHLPTAIGGTMRTAITAAENDAADEEDDRTPQDSNFIDFIGNSDVVETENDSFGLNFAWQASSNLNLEFDAHWSSSEAQPNAASTPDGTGSSDFLIILAGPLNPRVDVDFSGGVPTVTIDDSGLPADTVRGQTLENGYLSADGVRPNLDITRTLATHNEVDQYQLRGEWENASDSPLRAINFGLGYIDYQMDTHLFFNLTGWGYNLGLPNACTGCADFVELRSTRYPSAFPATLAFNARELFYALPTFTETNELDPTLYDVDDDPDTTEVDETATRDLTNRRNRQVSRIEPPWVLQNFRHSVSEETLSLYMQFDVETEFNGMPFEALFGFRYEDTDVSGTTQQNVPELMQYLSATELRARNSDEITSYTLNGGYTLWLPSMDLSLEPKEDVLVKLSYGRSLSRPDLNHLRPSLSIADARPMGPFRAAQGNPDLLPYVSDNLDLALEWFYGEGSYLSVNYFKKWVDNYVETQTTEGTIRGALGYDLTNPAARMPEPIPDADNPPEGLETDPVIIWEISNPVNAQTAEVDGLEFAVQHLFGDTGFGIQANWTLVDGDVEFDPRNLMNTVALTGLSDSANLVVFYENHGYQVRLAYNWRDEFLFATDQLRTTQEPVWVDEYGQLDLRLSYSFAERYTVFVEGINILEEETRSRGRFENHFLRYAEQDARYSFGIQASF